MKNTMFLLALCLSACFPKEATTDAETVWLRDVTTRLLTVKQGVAGPDLPDQLSFHLKRRTQNLVLNLKRNYQIDPNTDIYIMQKLRDGQSVLEKKQNSEKTDVAYYQNMENGAFMTARCVKRSSGQCDIIINGNIRLGDRNYSLRPSEAYVTQNDILDIMHLRGKRYVLQEQANIQSGMSVGNNEQTNIIERNVQEKFINGLQRISYGEDKRDPYLKPEDKTRNRNNYYVDVVVAADSSVWDLFFAIARDELPHQRVDKTHKNLREYFLHIVNGVDQLYKGIDDYSISISVSIRAFVTWPTERDFPHLSSRVQHTGTGSMIDGDKYLQDLKLWDINTGSRDLPPYDQVILFTKHELHPSYPTLTHDDVRSIDSGVCDVGRRIQIVCVDDFFATTRSTAHGLGHALGAIHDGDGVATACRAEDRYIMSALKPAFYPGKKRTSSPWLFSPCSVDAIKKTLVKKTCLNTKFVHDQDIQDEMRGILRIQPGKRYSPNEQCVIINGVGSKYTGRKDEAICAAMRCTYPPTNTWNLKTVPAAPGTPCGDNKDCQKGWCVAIQ